MGFLPQRSMFSVKYEMRFHLILQDWNYSWKLDQHVLSTIMMCLVLLITVIFLNEVEKKPSWKKGLHTGWKQLEFMPFDFAR